VSKTWFPDDPTSRNPSDFITPDDPVVLQLAKKIGREPFADHLAENIQSVYYWVCWNVRYMSDQERWGERDHWQLPSTTIRLGTGDCEDQAMLLTSLLRAVGLPRDHVHMVFGWLDWLLGGHLGYHGWVEVKMPGEAAQAMRAVAAQALDLLENRTIVILVDDEALDLKVTNETTLGVDALGWGERNGWIPLDTTPTTEGTYGRVALPFCVWLWFGYYVFYLGGIEAIPQTFYTDILSITSMEAAAIHVDKALISFEAEYVREHLGQGKKETPTDQPSTIIVTVNAERLEDTRITSYPVSGYVVDITVDNGYGNMSQAFITDSEGTIRWWSGTDPKTTIWTGSKITDLKIRPPDYILNPGSDFWKAWLEENDVPFVDKSDMWVPITIPMAAAVQTLATPASPLIVDQTPYTIEAKYAMVNITVIGVQGWPLRGAWVQLVDPQSRGSAAWSYTDHSGSTLPMNVSVTEGEQHQNYVLRVFDRWIGEGSIWPYNAVKEWPMIYNSEQDDPFNKYISVQRGNGCQVEVNLIEKERPSSTTTTSEIVTVTTSKHESTRLTPTTTTSTTRTTIETSTTESITDTGLTTSITTATVTLTHTASGPETKEIPRPLFLGLGIVAIVLLVMVLLFLKKKPEENRSNLPDEPMID